MSQIEIRQVTADDHAAWLPLWQAYLRFYNTELPEAVTQSTWQRMLASNESTPSALAWVGSFVARMRCQVLWVTASGNSVL